VHLLATGVYLFFLRVGSLLVYVFSLLILLLCYDTEYCLFGISFALLELSLMWMICHLVFRLFFSVCFFLSPRFCS
jgi:hypothetical protein